MRETVFGCHCGFSDYQTAILGGIETSRNRSIRCDFVQNFSILPKRTIRSLRSREFTSCNMTPDGRFEGEGTDLGDILDQGRFSLKD
jgi:hypothetical protein